MSLRLVQTCVNDFAQLTVFHVQIQWFGLEFALIMIGTFVVVQAAVSCAYVLDCYKELALEVMVGE